MSSLYILSKLFTYLVLPPGMFILLFFFASIYARRFRLFFCANAILFYLLSNIYVADWLLRPLEEPFNQALLEMPVDAVIVLGGGHTQGVANLPLSSDAYKRMMWGLMVAKSHHIPLLFSGGGMYKAYLESDAFLQSLKELKTYLEIPTPSSKNLASKEFSLHVEDKSLDTYQNAQFSKMAFEKAGVNKPTIYLVTSAYHMRRATKLYEYFGFNVIPAATNFKINHRAKDGWDYLPSAHALHKSYIALHEYAGLLSLQLRGI
ncbi:YdcF family protein [Sulfurospirillum barnesii]|uniref:DUF218 domain-containing protein n=1 Tax=Sulfurospirillum barnesii (strain ATCC 700032 / DSM 10660 / SES-3) TaxID=760154 RepID=I3XTZ2_SULBS|nr:YdcF family protein [Sulfurospirillum barnesii]AFL67416.1 hypothetical protein Sulba_0087 [Sulfurospirillum barnesii SES-3]